MEHNHTQTHHKTHEHTKHTGLLQSQPFLLHSRRLRRLYSQGWLCIAGSMPWMMSKHRRQPAQKHTDSKARHGMARGLNNTTAKHGFGRCGTDTVIYSFFSSTGLSDHLLEVEVGTCDLDTANNKEAANMQQLYGRSVLLKNEHITVYVDCDVPHLLNPCLAVVLFNPRAIPCLALLSACVLLCRSPPVLRHHPRHRPCDTQPSLRIKAPKAP